MSHSDRRWDWWFGEDALPVPSVNAQAEWKEHPFDALENGKGLTLYRRDGENRIDQRDAVPVLRAFACYEAGGLVRLWNPPQVVREYLQTGDPRLSEQAKVAGRAALDQADLDMQSAAQVMKAAEAKCPKIGFFARAATRAAALEATKDYARAVAAYHHRGAVMHAVSAALFATTRGTPHSAWAVADAAINTAGMLAAEEGVIIASNDSPNPTLLPRGVAQAAGSLAATANIRTRFSTMVDRLFSC